MTMTVFNTLFLIAFSLSVLVQFNDPDTAAWVVLYGSAAAMCAARHLQRCPRWLPVGLLVITLLWTGALLPSLSGVSLAAIFASINMQTEGVEQAREVGGLALVALWSAVLLHRGNR